MATPTRKPFAPFPEGMNAKDAAHTLNDTEAAYLQDVLLDEAGYARQRGPVKKAAGTYATWERRLHGICGDFDPAGQYSLNVIDGDDTGAWFNFLPVDLSTKASYQILGKFKEPAGGEEPLTFDADDFYIFDAKPAVGGGTLITLASRYGHGAIQYLAYWRGARLPQHDGTTGSLDFAVSHQDDDGTTDARTIVGTGVDWTNWEPGMFLFAECTEDPVATRIATNLGAGRQVYVGQVLEVFPDDDQVILAEPPLVTGASVTNWSLHPIRGVNPRVSNGRITCATGDKSVNGGLTTFRDERLKIGTWCIYRQSDMRYLGLVDHTASMTNIQLLLTDFPEFDMDDEDYVAVQVSGNWDLDVNTGRTIRKPGVFTAPWAERQFFANVSRYDERVDLHSRLYYSDVLNFETMAIAGKAGQFFDVHSTKGPNVPIMYLAPSPGGLIIWKSNELFLLTGEDPSTFSYRKVLDDGCLSAQSIVPWNDGYIFAGKKGIWFYNGIQEENLSDEKLGKWWREAVKDIDPETTRLWAMIANGHYMVYDPETNTPTRVVPPPPETYTFEIVKEQSNDGGTTWTSDPLEVNIGDTISYRVTVHNTGTGALVIDLSDDFLTDLSPSGSVDLAGGDSQVYTGSYVVLDSDITITNEATATATPPPAGGAPFAHSATVVANVPQPPTFIMEWSPDGETWTTEPGSIHEDDVIYIRATFTNLTPDPIDFDWSTENPTLFWRDLADTMNLPYYAFSNNSVTGWRTDTETVAPGDFTQSSGQFGPLGVSNYDGELTGASVIADYGLGAGPYGTDNGIEVSVINRANVVIEQSLDGAAWTTDPITVAATDPIHYRLTLNVGADGPGRTISWADVQLVPNWQGMVGMVLEEINLDADWTPADGSFPHRYEEQTVAPGDSFSWTAVVAARGGDAANDGTILLETLQTYPTGDWFSVKQITATQA